MGTNPRSLAVADFNRDGKLDLAVANNGSDNVSVLLGNGTGGFGTPTILSAGVSPSSIAVGNLNADANPDLVVVNQSDNTVAIRLGNGSGGFGTATTGTFHDITVARSNSLTRRHSSQACRG